VQVAVVLRVMCSRRERLSTLVGVGEERVRGQWVDGRGNLIGWMVPARREDAVG
jgi:hypothetical protein